MIWPGWPDFTCWWATSRRARAAWPRRLGAVRGRVLGTYCKRELPNYSVFDEQRYFSAHGEALVFNVLRFDARRRPSRRPGAAGAQRLAVQHRQRKSGWKWRVAAPGENRYALIYANMVGGQDELVFDGASFALDAAGEPARLPDFAEGVNFVEVDAQGGVKPASAQADCPPGRAGLERAGAGRA